MCNNDFEIEVTKTTGSSKDPSVDVWVNPKIIDESKKQTKHIFTELRKRQSPK